MLGPISSVYGSVASVRNAAYDRWLLTTQRSPLPVLCVGNVTVGGSGKTPFTAYLAEHLVAVGKRPCVLTRGYGGKYSGPYHVSSSDDARRVGDEALLHAAHLDKFGVSVVIAKERSLGASYIAAHDLGDIIILDDGYQHRRLERDFNILLLDVSTEESIAHWLNGDILPLGRLRESLSQALERANCVVFVNRLPSQNDEVAQLAPYLRIGDALPKFQLNLKPSHVVDVASGQRFSLASLDNRFASALTAIANPSHFFKLLDTLGVKREKNIAYRDHHQFTQKEWDKALRQGNGLVVTTAKDAVKLRRFVGKTNQLLSVVLSPSFCNEQQESEFQALVSDTIDVYEERYENSE